MPKSPANPPVIGVFGDDGYQKNVALTRALDALLPRGIDRSLALSAYDGALPADQGGPSISAVLEDLATLPFLASHRVVLIRDADAFVAAHRERLEKYLARPAPTGALLLECRSFPKTTRLSKTIAALGGQLTECRKLAGRALVDFVVNEARARHKHVERAAAARLVDLIGQDAGSLTSELDKLALYAADRPTISDADVSELVGQSREEKIFAVLDAAAVGRLPDALRLWRQVLATDPEAVYKALGGIGFKVRQWLGAHRLHADGVDVSEIASKLMMWRREADLLALFRRLSPTLLRRLLAAIANLDSQAKSGARSIETGVEHLLIRLAVTAR